jgi:hypothetical protein
MIERSPRAQAMLLDSMFDLPSLEGRQGGRDLSAGRGRHR